MTKYIDADTRMSAEIFAKLLKLGEKHKIYTHWSPITPSYVNIFARTPLFCIKYLIKGQEYYVYGNTVSKEIDVFVTRCGVMSSISLVISNVFKTPGPHAPISKVHINRESDDTVTKETIDAVVSSIEDELLKLL